VRGLEPLDKASGAGFAKGLRSEDWGKDVGHGHVYDHDHVHDHVYDLTGWRAH
jgi:hypothetical protein